jgi:hypothetical protein
MRKRMEPQRADTEACDGFDIGWGIVTDGERILVLTPKRHGIAIRKPVGFSAAGELSSRFGTHRI